MATKDEIKTQIRDRFLTELGLSPPAPPPEGELPKIGLAFYQNDILIDELYSGFSWSENVISFWDPSEGLPENPLMFDRYISTETAGGWQADYVYEWNGNTWTGKAPVTGEPKYVIDEKLFYFYNGNSWELFGGSGGVTDHRNLTHLNSLDYWHLTEANHLSLTDGSDTDLHYHVADRNRSNHTGTQSMGTIEGLDDALAGKESFGTAAALLGAHESHWDHDSFLAALPAHGHVIADITGLQTALDGKQPLDSDLTAIAALTHSNRHVVISNGTAWVRRALESDDVPALAIAKITGLQTALDGKAASAHTHLWAHITDKPSTFAPSAHTHIIADVTGLQTALDGKQPLDADLTAIAALTHSNRHVMISNGSAWARRGLEAADIPALPYASTSHASTHLSGGSDQLFNQNLNTNNSPTFFSQTLSSELIGSGASGIHIRNNTSDGADTKTTLISGGGSYESSRGATIVLRGNEYAAAPGTLQLIAGSGSGGSAGAVVVSPRLVIGNRPANDIWWSVAISPKFTLFDENDSTRIMYNLYYEGGQFKYRQGGYAASMISQLYNGGIAFGVAPVGVNPGDPLTLTSGLHIAATGHVGILQSGSSSYALSVNGSMATTANVDAGGDAYVRGSLLVTKNGMQSWRDVVQFRTTTPSFTGICKITLPKSWSDTMMVIKITGYHYLENVGAWECIIGAYNYSSTPSWIRTSAEIRGNAPFNQVRLAHDGTHCCILLGTTSTSWSYPQIAVSNAIFGFQNSTGWGTPWSLSFVSTEAGLTNIMSPPLAINWHSGNFTPSNYVTINTVQDVSGQKNMSALHATGNLWLNQACTVSCINGNGTWSPFITTQQVDTSGTQGAMIIQNTRMLGFTTVGIAAPLANGRSSGTRVVLYPIANQTEFAQGIESGNMWFSAPIESGVNTGFKWYLSNSNVMRLQGEGVNYPRLTLEAAYPSIHINPTSAGSLIIGSAAAGQHYHYISRSNMTGVLSIGAVYNGDDHTIMGFGVLKDAFINCRNLTIDGTGTINITTIPPGEINLTGVKIIQAAVATDNIFIGHNSAAGKTYIRNTLELYRSFVQTFFSTFQTTSYSAAGQLQTVGTPIIRLQPGFPANQTFPSVAALGILAGFAIQVTVLNNTGNSIVFHYQQINNGFHRTYIYDKDSNDWYPNM